MASFDFIGAANAGYQTSWKYRQDLLRLAGLPLLIKIGCLAVIILMGFEENVLRHGIVMLPSYFAEGFLISYIIRMLHAGSKLDGDIQKARAYSNDILAGMIVYVLVKLVLAFVVGMTVSGLPADMPEDVQSPPPMQVFATGMIMIAFLVWSFRFLWLYVPIAMGIPLPRFLEKIHSFRSSIPMLGCWLACFMPLTFLMLLISRMLLLALPQSGVEGGDHLSILVVSAFQGGMELVISVVASIAMSYGFKSLMENK